MRPGKTVAAALSVMAVFLSGFAAKTQTKESADRKARPESYVGCLERVSVASNELVLTSTRPADQKPVVAALAGNRRLRVTATKAVDLQSWAGYEVTITGTVAHDEAKGQGEHGTAAAALPTLTATSVKRHGMTCPE